MRVLLDVFVLGVVTIRDHAHSTGHASSSAAAAAAAPDAAAAVETQRQTALIPDSTVTAIAILNFPR